MAELEGREKINLKGIIVANPATHWKYDTTPSYLPFAYMHNLMSKKTWDTFQENDCVWYFRNIYPGSTSKECLTAYLKFQKDTSRINWYDIYRDVYDGPIGEPKLGYTEIAGETHTYQRGFTMSQYTPWLADMMPDDEPILGDYMSQYMNKPEVREALNIPDKVQPYQGCVTNRKWSYNLQNEGSFWIYELLKMNNYKILVFSGDTDGAVPTYGTERWIKDLGWEITSKWSQWMRDGQVKGYKTSYDGLDFVTVHGVGHMAPQWAREEVTSMINGFMFDEDY